MLKEIAHYQWDRNTQQGVETGKILMEEKLDY